MKVNFLLTLLPASSVVLFTSCSPNAFVWEQMFSGVSLNFDEPLNAKSRKCCSVILRKALLQFFTQTLKRNLLTWYLFAEARFSGFLNIPEFFLEVMEVFFTFETKLQSCEDSFFTLFWLTYPENLIKVFLQNLTVVYLSKLPHFF